MRFVKIARLVVPLIEEAMGDTPVVIVNGARQVGKSTLVTELLQLGSDAEFVTLDHEPTLRAASDDPRTFVERRATTLVIDEAQREPRLFRAIKASVDIDRRPGRFLLTGSARLLAVAEMADAMVGRVELVDLWPLSEVERLGAVGSVLDLIDIDPAAIVRNRRIDRLQLAELIVGGGFPEAISRSPTRRRAWFESYADTSITRVVNQVAAIERAAEIPRLLRLLAARTATELNVSNLASTFGWPGRTLDAYLAHLANAFVLQIVPAWSTNLSSKVVHRPKIHMVDTGLATALTGHTSDHLLKSPELFGSLLETFAAMELRKQTSWSSSRPSLWHFRDRGGAEVDIVIEYPDGRIVGIEIKSGATPSHADAQGLRLLRDRLGDRFHHGYLASTASEAHPIGDRLAAIPITALWTFDP